MPSAIILTGQPYIDGVGTFSSHFNFKTYLAPLLSRFVTSVYVHKNALVVFAVFNESITFRFVKKGHSTLADEVFWVHRLLFWNTNFDVLNFYFFFVFWIRRNSGNISVLIYIGHHFVKTFAFFCILLSFFFSFFFLLFCFFSSLFSVFFVPGFMPFAHNCFFSFKMLFPFCLNQDEDQRLLHAKVRHKS